MKICQIAAELSPFAKTGGLGDVASGLSSFLARQGGDVRIFVPYYTNLARTPEKFPAVDFIQGVPLQLGALKFTYGLRTTKLPGSEVDVYFVDCPDLYGAEGIYQGDWADARRFAVLTLAAFEACQRMGWGPDIVHVHDWHTSLAPIFLKSHFAWDRLFEKTKTVLTIHNAGYQGVVDRELVEDLGLAQWAYLFHQEDYRSGHVNHLKNGILHADVVTAVSPTYAREIQDNLGYGLEPWLRARGVIGLINGVDYGEWDPATDPHLPAHFSIDDLAGKAENKRALLRDAGLDREGEERLDIPLLGIVSRLTPQKGFDLLFSTLPLFLAHRDVRLVALGSGEPRYEEFFASLQGLFPTKVWFYKGFNNPLAHRIEAAADLFLMPSKFEPCGLNQMYSLRYGTPPIVHKTGGLADTVAPFDSSSGRGTGFVFEHFTPEGFAWALGQALDLFPNRPLWDHLMQNGMSRNFSWDEVGTGYVSLYNHLVSRGRG
ncbi:MAG TPA: glycogen synthase [Thermoanaerobaculia bacterium]|nr:glycogen synthase [Thermoanaerobaculia bacterium]